MAAHGMIARRDILLGGACVAGAGLAYGLKPRNEILLLPREQQLVDLVPLNIPGWTGQDVGDPLALNQEGSLSARLYNQLVTRLYTETASGARLMMLLAYGAQQNDDLQLHRPEVCYPAFGYELVRNDPVQLKLGAGLAIPARRLVAQNANGREYVTYWSRLGEFLPQDGGEQREARFLNAFRNIIPDGVLCRFSIWQPEPDDAWGRTNAFVATLMESLNGVGRRVLIGSERAAALTGLKTDSLES